MSTEQTGQVIGDGSNVDLGKPDPTIEEGSTLAQTTETQLAEEQTVNVDYSKPAIEQIENLLNVSGLDSKAVADYVNANGGEVSPDILRLLVEKHGEGVASLVAKQLKDFYENQQADQGNRDQEVFDTLKEAFKDITDQSGEESWKELNQWASQHVDAGDRRELNKLLQEGGYSAKLAINDLITRFKSSNGISSEADLVKGSQGNTSGGLEPLSRKDYVTQLAKLEAEGEVYGSSDKMAKLDRQRILGQERGL